MGGEALRAHSWGYILRPHLAGSSSDPEQARRTCPGVGTGGACTEQTAAALLPGAQLRSGEAQRLHTSSTALSAERWTPGRGSRGRPSFRQLNTGGGTAWLWHSRATDVLATTDTFSSSPRMLGGTEEGTGEAVSAGDVGLGQPHPAAGANPGDGEGWGPHPELQLSNPPLSDL